MIEVMDDSWVTLILLGLAASFMPLVFSLEIYMLGSDDGVKKVSSLLGGITLFRLLITFLVVLLFMGMLASLAEGLSSIGQFLGSLLSRVDTDVTSGQHLFVDLLLVASGIAGWFRIRFTLFAKGNPVTVEYPPTLPLKSVNLTVREN